MASFIIRRLIALIPVMCIVLVIVFSLVRLIPGDPAVTLLGPGATKEQIDALRAQLDLDQPVVLQFANYVFGLLKGDLGFSLKSGLPVTGEILTRLPATIELSVLAVIVAIILGIPIGVLSAVRPNSIFDHVTRVVSLVGVSMPAFLLALILQLIFATYLGWLPVSGRMSSFLTVETVTGFAVLDGIITGNFAAAWSAVQHLILPTAVLASFLAATLGRFVRNTMLDVMGEDFIRTARAKGVRRSSVVLNHGLRNSLLPAITVIGLKFAEMLGGAILTETIFAWPGIGRYMFEAIKNRDYPVIQGTTLVFALMFVLTSIIVDLLYGVLDPRIRRKMG
ncbi:Dipeptide transporter permease DppB [Neorhizobium galegae bv. officinalis bv. officinalis str. HAMBI 1141]|uniref:Dipeptide transporter permease DppB n=1 Tax=Neorhizobium galegae bv. officinalis bv. officinalis str. HAMBI 1141 TaxID=1028801 RepID=A0A068T9K7_NEOGA|nr:MULTISPECIES: ABC transporter permease [Neorhizobium]MCJ9750098.1 ABC transporter permease [Neorhizobium sp. BETTINA12A]CDN55207.1 Dipeptide transporter permease DppB [Neorhizobium galegae bv. officinalis bv. officinalis str. HAMBI 1141]